MGRLIPPNCTQWPEFLSTKQITTICLEAEQQLSSQIMKNFGGVHNRILDTTGGGGSVTRFIRLFVVGCNAKLLLLVADTIKSTL
jgi:hypothetical protein